MKKTLVILFTLIISFNSYGQKHTYYNNKAAKFTENKAENYVNSSFSWTISIVNDGMYRVYYKPCLNDKSCGFCVEYSHQNSETKEFIYKPASSSKFEGETIKMVITTGELYKYAEGNASKGKNLLTIIFTNGTGLIYQLGN